MTTDGQTDEFQPLPDQVTQVESDLEVSVQPTAEIVTQADRFLPVGWVWRAGAAMPASACEMDWDEEPGDATRPAKYEMSKGDL